MARQRAAHERRPPIDAGTREAIRERIRAGDDYRDVARAFDVSYGTVSNTAVRMGIRRKAPLTRPRASPRRRPRGGAGGAAARSGRWEPLPPPPPPPEPADPDFWWDDTLTLEQCRARVAGLRRADEELRRRMDALEHTDPVLFRAAASVWRAEVEVRAWLERRLRKMEGSS